MADPILEGAKHWAGLGRVAFIGPAGVFPDVPEGTLDDPDLLKKLHYDRAVKTPYELECMRRANQLGARGHREAFAAFLDGASEYETHMRYLEACAQREEEMPYNNIVAYNENAAVLHYQHLERRPPHSLRSFLIDAGAQFRGYAADITRTYAAASGPFSDLIAALNTAQLRLCDEIVSGRDYREVHLSAHRLVGDVLEQIGVTTLPGQAALEAGVTGVFFPHGIGHLLGLQVHDVGGVMGDPKGGERARPEGHPYLRLTRMLEPGVVVTIEPGIYFIDSLLEGRSRGRARQPYRLEHGGATAALWRHSHRGQRRDDRQRPGKHDPGRVRGARHSRLTERTRPAGRRSGRFCPAALGRRGRLFLDLGSGFLRSLGAALLAVGGSSPSRP